MCDFCIIEWKYYDTIGIYSNKSSCGSGTELNDSEPAIVAAFDLDNTIITTSSGALIPKNKNDWKFMNEKVPLVIENLMKNGYTVIILSNQAGSTRSIISRKRIESIIEAVTTELNLQQNPLDRV